MECQIEIRLKNELRRNLHPSTAYVGFKQVADRDLFRFIGTIIGPSDTPYEGGVFSLSIKIPHTYPMTPPKITFLTKVFHPNITEDGIIHVDVLGDNWLPTLTIEKMLLSICSFLDDPNPEDPLNPICCLYRNHRETYIKKAREWTKKYAMSY
ncbi:ubiquitin-conjugating enzyme E2 4-like [Humulus lupulus]|uniref:ubiquitin-conjugating enzyme E2 4-like n=1 Tax=Humulus lupulus TaxID=3486 RepID=UPI002B407889|nr:ubiquitin-conjugating enzyme E2 4-like [Humulus lupulus]